MFHLSLNRGDGLELKISIPENASELKLSQKIKIDFGISKIASFLKKMEDAHEQGLTDNIIYRERGNYLMIVAQNISDILDIDLTLMMNMNGLSLLEMTEDEFKDIVAGNINKDQLSKHLISIWTMLSNVVTNTKPGDIKDEINFGGRTYILPKYIEDPFGPKHEAISYQQAVEILNRSNLYYNWLENNRSEEGGPKDHEMLHSKACSEIAILLCRDEIPSDPDAFNPWLNAKMLEFEHIDWQTYSYIQNWFNNYIEELKANPENKYFFESAYQPATATEASAYATAKEKSKEIFNAVGYKGMLPRLLELNPFGGESKLKSILKSSFSSIVKIISLDNASKT